MYSKILVPTDLTEKSELAIQQAFRLATPNESVVTLLHVVEKLSDGDDEDVESFYTLLAEKARLKLNAWKKQYSADYPNVDIETAILVGKRAREILRTSENGQADLIVMTSHTFNKNEERSFGTLSHQVALFSSCSVLVVR